jgi:YHS domain-containing protein
MTSNALTSLLYFLAFGFLFYWMMRKGGCGMHGHRHGGHAADHAGDLGPGDQPSRSARDAVCGMDVDPAQAAGTRSVMGRTFYLCSAACLTKFDRDPEGYAQRASTGGTPPGQEHLQHHGS